MRNYAKNEFSINGQQIMELETNQKGSHDYFNFMQS